MLSCTMRTIAENGVEGNFDKKLSTCTAQQLAAMGLRLFEDGEQRTLQVLGALIPPAASCR